MTSFFRRLFAVVALLGVLAPATASVCLRAGARHCTESRSSHDCCEGPRVARCDCQMTHGGIVPAEPVQRRAVAALDLTPADAPASAWDLVPDRPRAVSVEAPSPPRSAGDRLSLLSILLV